MGEPAAGPPPISARAKALVLVISCLVTAGLAEVIVRVASGGALPNPPLFQQEEPCGIGVVSNGEAVMLHASGRSYPLRTGAHGLREPVPEPGDEPPWLVVGDSQVLGMGVDGDQTFSARVSEEGPVLFNGGVLGYGVSDSLCRADALSDTLGLGGVVVFVNQANDWEEADTSVTDRYRVRGGWLLRTQHVGSIKDRFLSSPLSSSHLLFYTAVLTLGDRSVGQGTPPWMADPAGQAPVTATIMKDVRDFAAAHPGLGLLVAYLPLDMAAAEERGTTSAFAGKLSDQAPRPWQDTSLRDQVVQGVGTLPFLDLLPVLRERPEAFLDSDYHLSPDGHERVAQALRAALLQLTGDEGGKSAIGSEGTDQPTAEPESDLATGAAQEVP